MCSLRLQFADLFHNLPLAHKIIVNQAGGFHFSQTCFEDVFNFFQRQTNDPIVLSQSLWMFSVWLVFTSNLNSQTTWLKVKLKLTRVWASWTVRLSRVGSAKVRACLAEVLRMPFSVQVDVKALKDMLGSNIKALWAQQQHQEEQHKETGGFTFQEVTLYPDRRPRPVASLHECLGCITA